MSYCGTSPGMCGHRPDCKDTHCEGHPSLYQSDGGHYYRDGLSFPMNPGEGMEQDEPLYSYDSVTAPIPWCIWIGASVCALLCFYILCGGADELYLYVLREW